MQLSALAWTPARIDPPLIMRRIIIPFVRCSLLYDAANNDRANIAHLTGYGNSLAP